MTDDVIFSLPLLSMTLIMSEEYHQELSTSTLHSPSMRPRDSSQSELLILFAEIFHQIFEHFQRNIVFLCNLCQSRILYDGDNSLFERDEAETTLGMSHNPRPHICLEAAAITREHILDRRVLGVLLLMLLHPVLDVGLVPALLHEAVVPGPALVPLVCLYILQVSIHKP